MIQRPDGSGRERRHRCSARCGSHESDPSATTDLPPFARLDRDPDPAASVWKLIRADVNVACGPSEKPFRFERLDEGVTCLNVEVPEPSDLRSRQMHSGKLDVFGANNRKPVFQIDVSQHGTSN